jgi:hypothetical protein
MLSQLKIQKTVKDVGKLEKLNLPASRTVFCYFCYFIIKISTKKRKALSSGNFSKAF